jgi:hypothetical protein
MGDAELLKFGQSARLMCAPGAKSVIRHAKKFVIQLEEARRVPGFVSSSRSRNMPLLRTTIDYPLHDRVIVVTRCGVYLSGQEKNQF